MDTNFESDLSLDEDLRRFLIYQRDHQKVAPDTLRLQRRLLVSLSEHAGARLRDLTARQVQEWVTSLCAGSLSPVTVRGYFKKAKPFFSWAQRDGLVEPLLLFQMSQIKPPPGSKPPGPRPYSAAEVAEFWAALEQHWPRTCLPGTMRRYERGQASYRRVWRDAMNLQTTAIASLALIGGLRHGEILRATIDDIHPDNDYVTVSAPAMKGANRGHDRSERLREVAMPPELRKALAEWLDFRFRLGPSHAAPWLNLQAGIDEYAPLPGKKVGHPLNPISAAAFGRTVRVIPPGWSLQRMRHTAGTEWLRAGLALEDVSELLGHSSLQQTLAYAEIVGSDVRARARRVEDKVVRVLAKPEAA